MANKCQFESSFLSNPVLRIAKIFVLNHEKEHLFHIHWSYKLDDEYLL